MSALRTLAALLLGAALVAHAQDFGDTPYVQTPQVVVDRMLEVAKPQASDFVIDLGSGDGRMVITAAKRYGARGFGVDLDKRLVTLANRRAAQAGVADRAKFYAQDLHDTDLSRATIVTIYLLPEVNLMVRPRLLQLAPGTRIVSHDYDMGDWPPDVSFVMDAPGKSVGRDLKSKVFGWTVPGNAAGRWVWRDAELELQQNFQQLTGTLTVGGRKLAVEEAKMDGNRIRFAVPGAAGARQVYAGRLVNHAIDGDVETVSGGTTTKASWSAARTEVGVPAHVNLPPPTFLDVIK